MGIMELEVVRIVMGLHTFVTNVDQFCKHPLAVVLLDFVGFADLGLPMQMHPLYEFVLRV